MTTQVQESGRRYPQATEPGHFQQISQPQGISKIFICRKLILYQYVSIKRVEFSSVINILYHLSDTYLFTPGLEFDARFFFLGKQKA